jgi:phosphocarrier protein
MSHDWETGKAVIRDPTGLHARPAVKLTKLAKRFGAQIEVRYSANGHWINAKSPSAVMKLKAPAHAVLEVRAHGGDARPAVDAICALIERNFDDIAAE